MTNSPSPPTEVDEKPSSHMEDVLDPIDESNTEVFRKTNDGVDFRIVGWPRASMIFMKRKLQSLDYFGKELTSIFQ